MKKQKAGDELTEEELEVLKEKRERIRKKDLEDIAPVKGGKGKAPAKPDKKAAGKGAPPPEKVEEEDESKKRQLPEPENHTNDNIVSFLKHYKSERLIQITCPNPEKNGRKRTDDEKDKMKLDCTEKRSEEKTK